LTHGDGDFDPGYVSAKLLPMLDREFVVGQVMHRSPPARPAHVDLRLYLAFDLFLDSSLGVVK
jgi:hypothetical protein